MFTETYFTNRLSGALILSILFTFIFNTFISAREKNHSFYFIPQLGQSGKIVSVWFDKDENYFYSKSESQSIIKWNLGGRILNKTYVNNKSDSRGFRLIAERCNTPNLNKIKIKFKYEDKSYSINDGNKNYKIKLRYKYSGNCYDYHPAAKMILIANDDGSIAIVKSGKILKEFKAHQKRINMIKFNSSGSQFITASNDSKLSIWSNAGIRKKTMVHPCEITSASFSGSNSKTISGCRDGSIRIWNKKGKLLKKITPAVQSMVGAEFFPGNNK
ncbi:MAG: hypothetical protein OEZ34_03210, partial [Spirochaetia bacterium]|nr:hypothetical protein [Spirochaetia bacterium]